MVDVTINAGEVRFTSSVLGEIVAAYGGVEVVDEGSLHLETGTDEAGYTTHLLNVAQFSFNEQVFGDAIEAVAYIESIV